MKTVDLLPKIEKGRLPDVERRLTGLWSFDELLKDRTRGLPMRTIVEIYGKEESGKSTLSYFLAGIPNSEGKVGIVDTESSLDPEYLQLAMSRSGFKGTVKIIDYAQEKNKKFIQRYHGAMAQEAMHGLLDEYDAIIVDSIAGWMPEAEQEGDIGDANMGRRARDVTQFSRGTVSQLKLSDTPKLCIAVNHVLQSLSSRGWYTPGGRGLSHYAGVRLWMWRNETWDDGTFQSKIKVEKLRWGGKAKDRGEAQVIIIPGHGVAKGMTAVFDCINLGLAQRPKGGYIKYKAMKAGEELWNSAGRLTELIDKEKEGDMAKFNPFFKLLKEFDDEREAT